MLETYVEALIIELLMRNEVKILKSAILSQDIHAAAHSALEDDNNLISLVTSLFV